MYICFSLTHGLVSIHNNFQYDVTFLFSNKDSIGYILGIQKDIIIKSGSVYTSNNVVVLQKESYVYFNINDYTSMDNIQNKSILYKHIFNKNNEPRQIKQFTPPIGKLYKIDVSFLNQNDIPYNFHGYNHSFNLRIKHS